MRSNCRKFVVSYPDLYAVPHHHEYRFVCCGWVRYQSSGNETTGSRIQTCGAGQHYLADYGLTQPPPSASLALPACD